MRKGWILFLFLGLFLSNCSKDDSKGTEPNINIGGGGNGNVTFTVTYVQDQQSLEFYFEFKPSTNVVITKLSVTSPITEDVGGLTNDVFSSTNPLYVGPVTGAQTGEVWKFNIQGNIGSTTGQTYNVNANCTIP